MNRDREALEALQLAHESELILQGRIEELVEALRTVRDWMGDVWDTPQQPPLELVQMIEALFERVSP